MVHFISKGKGNFCYWLFVVDDRKVYWLQIVHFLLLSEINLLM